MRISASRDFPAPVDRVHAVLTDQAFQEAKCAATSTGVYTVTITPAVDGTRVEASRDLPTDTLPDALKSVVGSTLKIIETVTWGAAAADGSRTGSVDLRIEGVPVTMVGAASLTPTAAGCTESFEGELKAKIPFVGGKVEQSASGPIQLAIETEFSMVAERL